MKHYVTPTLTDDRPDCIVLHVGTNDLKRLTGYSERSPDAIAK